MGNIMRVITTLLLVALAAPPVAAQTTARGMYTKLQSRERTARRALDAGKPHATVRRDAQRVVIGYEGLVSRFPRSGYSDNALWQAAFLAADCFARYRVEKDLQTSVRLLERLAKEYPTSPLIKRAAPALERLRAEVPGAKPAETAEPSRTAGAARHATDRPAIRHAADTAETPSTAAPSESTAPAASTSKDVAQIVAVRRTVLPGVVRVAIELDREVQFTFDRIENPVRVFLDIAATQPGRSLPGTIAFDDSVVKSVRHGPRPASGTRVVLDLEGAGRHSVFTLANPFRVVVDVERSAREAPGVFKAVDRGPAAPVLKASSEAGIRTPAPAAAPVAKAAPVPEIPTARVRVPEDEGVRPAPPIPASDTTSPGPLAARRAAGGAAATVAPPAPVAPSANAAGRFSLSRQLGLGINRIVIDPGHGGHDPGTKKRGLAESELVLDVAKRLEALLLREPGVEVVLTRRTDQFVPLEERTAIANRENADLFLSIHANSSRNTKAGGVETYFLNFASNPDAEAVAARENSASGRTMHHLPDIVKAITLNNKLDESRDFATLVQRAMVETLAKSHRGVRDRGVKQAPFVVLIGAGMPSVLAEISFMTNAQEGKLLKSGAYRQRIAEALFQGVRKYQRSLKAVTAVARQEQEE
jgi:N-acetylmuramoyl-L-alanine amidase